MEPGLVETAVSKVPGAGGRPDEHGRMVGYPAFAFSAHVPLVEVDPQTGIVRVLDYVVAHDCGTVINPQIVAGMVYGGIAHGLGAAFYEDFKYGPDGQLLNQTFMDYLLPSALEMPPVVINIVKQFTGEEPMRGIVGDVQAVIQQPSILSASVAQGYPYADVAEMGMAFLAISDGNALAAREAARWMARRAWDKRADFTADTPSADEALAAALAAPRGPVVLMDVGDNIGGGSPADSTVLLEAAKRLGAASGGGRSRRAARKGRGAPAAPAAGLCR